MKLRLTMLAVPLLALAWVAPAADAAAPMAPAPKSLQSEDKLGNFEIQGLRQPGPASPAKSGGGANAQRKPGKQPATKARKAPAKG